MINEITWLMFVLLGLVIVSVALFLMAVHKEVEEMKAEQQQRQIKDSRKKNKPKK